MKKSTITVAFEQEKLKAIQFYLGRNNTSLEAELDQFMTRLYKKIVPAQAREYIDSVDGGGTPPRSQPDDRKGEFS